MSVNRKRCESECVVCHAARPSVFRRWCDKCWAQLTNEEKLLAAEAAAAEEDAEELLAPPRLAQDSGAAIVVDDPDRRWYWEARGYEQTTVRATPFGSYIYVKRAR